MRITTLIIFLILTGNRVSPEWSSFPEALRLAQEEEKPVIVYVHAPWCGPCLRLERETFADQDVQQRLHRMARANLRIDAHDRIQRYAGYRLSEAEWAMRLGVETTPALVFLTSDGAVLGVHAGFIAPEELIAVLDEVLLRNDR